MIKRGSVFIIFRGFSLWQFWGFSLHNSFRNFTLRSPENLYIMVWESFLESGFQGDFTQESGKFHNIISNGISDSFPWFSSNLQLEFERISDERGWNMFLELSQFMLTKAGFLEKVQDWRCIWTTVSEKELTVVIFWNQFAVFVET